jgi:hypothetical protein
LLCILSFSLLDITVVFVTLQSGSYSVSVVEFWDRVGRAICTKCCRCFSSDIVSFARIDCFFQTRARLMKLAEHSFLLSWCILKTRKHALFIHFKLFKLQFVFCLLLDGLHRCLLVSSLNRDVVLVYVILLFVPAVGPSRICLWNFICALCNFTSFKVVNHLLVAWCLVFDYTTTTQIVFKHMLLMRFDIDDDLLFSLYILLC